MLYLISLGLGEKDLTLSGLEAAKKCDSAYIELYTNKLSTTIEELEKLTGKKIIELKRPDLEENSEKLIHEAKDKNVCVFVGGDALSATTHSSLVLDAKKTGVDVKVLHSSSIFTSIAETGLHLYKFGAATTLVYPEENYKPTSCYETILSNKKIGLHTLILLDVKPPKYMTVKEGLEMLLNIEKQKRQNLVSEDTFLIAASNLGSVKKIKYDTIYNLIREEFGVPAVIVFPGDLHFSEKEFLDG